MTRTLLLVEDDHALNDGVALALRGDGLRVLQAFDRASARELAARERPDLVILDIGLVRQPG